MNNTPELDKQLDEILLQPAHWQFSDYQKAKGQLKELIHQARIEELEWVWGNADDCCLVQGILKDDIHERIQELKEEAE